MNVDAIEQLMQDIMSDNSLAGSSDFHHVEDRLADNLEALQDEKDGWTVGEWEQYEALCEEVDFNDDEYCGG